MKEFFQKFIKGRNAHLSPDKKLIISEQLLQDSYPTDLVRVDIIQDKKTILSREVGYGWSKEVKTYEEAIERVYTSLCITLMTEALNARIKSIGVE